MSSTDEWKSPCKKEKKTQCRSKRATVIPLSHFLLSSVPWWTHYTSISFHHSHNFPSAVRKTNPSSDTFIMHSLARHMAAPTHTYSKVGVLCSVKYVITSLDFCLDIIFTTFHPFLSIRDSSSSETIQFRKIHLLFTFSQLTKNKDIKQNNIQSGYQDFFSKW